MEVAGNNFLLRETIPNGGKSFSTVGFPLCLAIRHPSRREAAGGRLHEVGADILMDGCLVARQGGSPTVETEFPPWEMVSHVGKWFPTMGNHSQHFQG